MSDIAVIAHVYGTSEASLIIAGLESAGITVLPIDYHVTTTLTNYTHAAGGMRICVPKAEAEEAHDVLASLGQFEPRQIKEWLVPIFIFAWFLGGVPPHASGVFPMRSTVHAVFA